MKKVRKIFLTTIALTATSFVMKTVAVWYNVYLTGKIGSAGIGLFQLILSVYAMGKTLASSGFHLAATRLCIDEPEKMRRNMRRLFVLSVGVGCAAAAVLFFLSPFLSENWIDEPAAGIPLKILSAALPFLAVSTSLNGYMTAVRKMSRYSAIQLLEQIARIAFTVFCIRLAAAQGLQKTLAVVCAGITFSEIFSFILSLSAYLWDMRKEKKKSGKGDRLFRRILRIAVPDALGSYIRSALSTVEHLLIPIGIRRSGAAKERSLAEYGAVQGMALPVVLYPSSMLAVLSGLLIPEIAECRKNKNEKEISYIINRVLHGSLYLSMLCAAALFVLSDEFSFVIYHNHEAANFIRLLAPLVPVMYLDMTTDGMLKGLDRQLTIMKINVLDSVLCVALVAILVPKMAVTGYIITIYTAEIINFLLSFRTLAKETSLRFSLFRNVVFPFLFSLSSMAAGKWIGGMIKKPTPALIVSAGVGLLLNWGMLRLSGAISREDAHWLKGLILPGFRRGPSSN